MQRRRITNFSSKFNEFLTATNERNNYETAYHANDVPRSVTTTAIVAPAVSQRGVRHTEGQWTSCFCTRCAINYLHEDRLPSFEAGLMAWRGCRAVGRDGVLIGVLSLTDALPIAMHHDKQAAKCHVFCDIKRAA